MGHKTKTRPVHRFPSPCTHYRNAHDMTLYPIKRTRGKPHDHATTTATATIATNTRPPRLPDGSTRRRPCPRWWTSPSARPTIGTMASKGEGPRFPGWRTINKPDRGGGLRPAPRARAVGGYRGHIVRGWWGCIRIVPCVVVGEGPTSHGVARAAAAGGRDIPRALIRRAGGWRRGGKSGVVGLFVPVVLRGALIGGLGNTGNVGKAGR